MGIPARGLPHTITRVRPATTTDGYGNEVRDYGAAATRTTGISAWLQQDQRSEKYSDGRSPNEQAWLLLTNEADIVTADQIEWTDADTSVSRVFTVEGPTEPAYTPAGFHHLEATLRVLAG